MVEVTSSTNTDSSGKIALIAEINLLLEALVRTGIRTQEARRLEVKFARTMSLYFRRLARKFPYSSLVGYVNQHRVKEASRLLESKKSDAKKLTGRAVEPQSEELRSIIEDNAAKGYLLGAEQAASAIRITPTFELVDEGAKNWIRKRAAAQVTNINEVTRDRLAKVLTEGVDKGQSVPQIAKNLRSQMTDMSKYRSNMIAQNELNESMSEASLQTYKRLDVKYKSWATALNPCEICRGNEAEGVVPIGHVFSSGHSRPPAHPLCVCALTPEKAPK